MISSPVQSVLYALITKSVGSGYRVRDDWRAPAPVRQTTIQREGILLGLTTVFTTAIQMLFTQILNPVMRRHPVLRKYELLLRGIATAPAMVIAEATSRQIAPKPSWTKAPHRSDSFHRQPDPHAAVQARPVQPSVHASAHATGPTSVRSSGSFQRFAAASHGGPDNAAPSLPVSRLSSPAPLQYHHDDDDD